MSASKNVHLVGFGRKLAELRKESGLTQKQLAADTPPNARSGSNLAKASGRNASSLVPKLSARALVSGFSAKTISDKERGIGTESPTLEFVRLYVQRCQEYRRRDVSDERYNRPLGNAITQYWSP